MAWKTTASDLYKTLMKSEPTTGFGWFTLALTAVGISFVGVGLVYMVGYLLNSEYIKRIAKAELYQALASLFLVALLFGVSGASIKAVELIQNQTEAFLIGITEGYEGRVKGGPFVFLYPFFRNLVDCAKNKIKGLYEESINWEIGGNTQITIVEQGKGYQLGTMISPLFFTEINKLEYYANEYSWLILLIYIQRYLTEFFETSMFTIFLPVGIVLRAFPPTRGAGAVLIATAIGFYLVYPTVYALLILSSYKGIPECGAGISINVKQVAKSCPLSPSAPVQALQSVTEKADISKLEAGREELRFYIYSFFLISLGVTLIFIRSAAGILGADISEIGRNMFKLL
jgi:hypothetical protein